MNEEKIGKQVSPHVKPLYWSEYTDHKKKPLNDSDEDKEDEEDYDDLPELEADPVFYKKEYEQNAIKTVQKTLSAMEEKKADVFKWDFPDIFALYLRKRIFDLLVRGQKVHVTSNGTDSFLQSYNSVKYRIQVKKADKTCDTTVSFRTNGGKFRITFYNPIEICFFRVFLGELFEEK
jgi:hypothetical protein